MKRFFVPRPQKQRAVTVDPDGMVRISPSAEIQQQKYAAYMRFMSLAGSPGEPRCPPSMPPGGPADTSGEGA